MSRSMTYTVTITSKSGESECYLCGGTTDQEALIFAGKVVEKNADGAEPDATVVIAKAGRAIGPPATVAEMRTRAV